MTLATPEPATSSPRTPTPLPLPLPLPIIDLVPLRAAAEPRPREEVEVLGLVARMIIDSLGRPWDPLKHPRDRKGRFIETFAEIRAFLKGKGSTKADFTGRVVAMDPDDTAIVQVRGGRGQYANLRDRLVRVPTEKLEGVEYKARIGQPAPRALPRSEMDKFLKRARGAGIRTDGMIGWKAEDPPDQLAELEKLAERAEKAGDITLRDALLAARARIRGESSNDDTINKAKALLPETREGSRDDKDIAPGDARGAEGEGRGDSSEVPAVEEDADADAGGGRGEQPRSRAGLRLPSGAGSDEDEWGDPGRLPSESVGDDAEFVDEYDLPEPADVDVQGAAAAAEHVGKKADQMARDALAVELRRDVHDLPEGYMQPNQKRDRAVEQLDRAIEDLQTSVEELERAQNNADRLRARARRMKKLGPPPRRPTQPVRPKRELFPDDNSYRDAMQDYQLQLNEYQADRQEYEEWQTTNARQGRVIADLARAENNLSRADNRVNRSIDRVQAKEDAVRRTLAQGRPQNFGQMLGALGRVLISKFKARRSSRPKGERKRAFGRGKRDARAPRRENSGVFNPRVTEQFVESLDDDDSSDRLGERRGRGAQWCRSGPTRGALRSSWEGFSRRAVDGLAGRCPPQVE